jgi:hypothetical protein
MDDSTSTTSGSGGGGTMRGLQAHMAAATLTVEEEERAPPPPPQQPQQLRKKIVWECGTCQRACFPIRSESRCLCNHRSVGRTRLTEQSKGWWGGGSLRRIDYIR